MSGQARDLAALQTRHDAAWRDPAAVAVQWPGAATIDPRLLEYRVRGAWWEVLAEEEITLLVTREYEHLVLAMRAASSGPEMSYLPLPHPSGLVADVARSIVYVASTRNPNQVWDLTPATGLGAAGGDRARRLPGRPLVPVRSRCYPGSLYLHDLALVGGRLHGNAVGHNAVVRLDPNGRHRRVWWPRAIETRGHPDFARNWLQLNSIAAGPDLRGSFFSASTDVRGARRPGQRHFAVDGRGVVFSGRTREPVIRGLTRPHSARLWRGRLWVANSGYGEIGVGSDGHLEPVVRLPGWTRGLAFHGRHAFAGTSRVLPRFRQYAPGLDLARSECALHAVDGRTGAVRGSLVWPRGNQLFAIVCVPSRFTAGLPFAAGRRRSAVRDRELFYAFETGLTGEDRSS